MKRKILLSFIYIFISTLIFAQGTITISGVVRDETKKPLPGATVSVPGTRIGTTTDSVGTYSLAVPKDAKTVVISYIGYDNKEFPVKSGGGDYKLNADMASSDISLNQVVVSVSKEKEKLLDAPASITIIGKDKLENNVVTTPVDELKGTAGVDIMRTGLISSNVVIRGFNDIFSGDVLNVVDDRIGSVPSLRVNAYQLVPTSTLDYDKIEVIRGPASALYGPNASSGVIAITTKDPLEQKDQFETTVSMTSGFTVLGTTPEPNATGGMSTYRQDNGGKALSGNILNPEFRHSGRTKNGIFGYKISGGYFQGQDYPNYDPREPYAGDSVIFGSVHNGNVFTPDTLQKYTHAGSNGQTVMDSFKLNEQRFKKDFSIRKWNADARFDIKPAKDILITVNGGISSSHNIELTGLGAAQAGGQGGWIYWYLQTKFKWKNLFIQYFINSSDAGNTYLIPQISPSDRGATPYEVQLLIDKSKLHVLQIQHSYRPISKLNFVYGADAQFVRPNTEGTINGLFEPVDYTNMAGLYVQGTYDPLKWLKLVAAFRADYNSIVGNVAASPRAAIVFKVSENQDIRLTYNRAFDAPNTLDQFLDLAQTQLPDGMYARGIGNPYGYNYPRDANGNIEFTPAPWGGANSVSTLQPVAYNSTAANVAQFDSIMNFIIKQLAPSAGGTANATTIIHAVFNGIYGPNGTVDTASHNALNLNNYGSTNNYKTSLITNPTAIQNLKKINNQYTQTLELGYKGFLFHKLSIQVDAFWTRISNYVSALTPASEAVVLNNSFLGPDNSSGILYRNLTANGGQLNHILSALDGTASLQNPTITPPVAGSVYDELVVLVSQLPIGDITPASKYVNSDYILTFQNLGRLDLLGFDMSLQYNVFETNRHTIMLSSTLSYIDKDQFILSTGQGVPLNAPKAKFSFSFNHTLKQSGFGYGLQFRYQMPYYGESSVYEGEVAPMYILDAQVSYRLKWYKKLLLAVNVNNVTNYQWSAFPGTPLMGTQCYVKALLSF
jgi:iron complex outermembrane receptor protein